MGKKTNEVFLNEKIGKEVKKIIAPKKLKDVKGLHAGDNKKMEEFYWFIPNVNMIRLFNDYVNKHVNKHFEGLNLQNKELIKGIHNFTLKNTICNEARCVNCSQYCYCEDSRFYLNNISSRFNRLVEYLCKPDLLKKKIIFQLTDASVCRLHTEGDFFNVEYFRWWIDIVRACPHVKFYTYTKQFEIVQEGLKGKRGLPKNFYLQVSLDKNYNTQDLPRDLLAMRRCNVYYVNDKTTECLKRLERLKEILGFETQKCKGKCSRCRNCYKSSQKLTIVDIH